MKVVVCPHCRTLNSLVAHTCRCGEWLSSLPAIDDQTLTPAERRAGRAENAPPSTRTGVIAPEAWGPGFLVPVGWTVMGLGFAALLGIFAGLETTVGDYGREVHNLGLIAEKLGWMLISATVAMCGGIVAVFGVVRTTAADDAARKPAAE